MLAMVVEHARAPLEARDVPVPEPGPDDVLVRVLACAVCRTDLHVVDGELGPLTRPVVPGHEVVGEVVARGARATRFALGALVGIPWLAWACGTCGACRTGRENLCPSAQFTGWTRDGGFAEYALADARFAVALPPGSAPIETAPLLCAGLIGYRSWRLAGEADRIGIYGFGAAGHLVAQLARHTGQEVYAFTRPGDARAQEFARGLGCAWAGGAGEQPPAPLDAAIIFAPDGALVPAALRAVKPGGTVVCGGIHMSDIPSFPYSLLWGERVLRSVANLTRADAAAFFVIASRAAIRASATPYALPDANRALEDLRRGRLDGAAVLVPRHADRSTADRAQRPIPA